MLEVSEVHSPNMKYFVYLSFLSSVLFQVVVGASLNGHCIHQDHCRVIDSVCKNSMCECNNITVQHNDYCVQVIESSEHCNSDLDCYPSYGNRSICKNKSCVCKEYHHLQNVGYPHLQCLKNRGLHESCMTDEDCYWGQDMLNKMRCIGYTCSCVPEYHEHQRKCSNANGIYNGTLYLLLIISYFTGRLM